MCVVITGYIVKNGIQKITCTSYTKDVIKSTPLVEIYTSIINHYNLSKALMHFAISCNQANVIVISRFPKVINVAVVAAMN